MTHVDEKKKDFLLETASPIIPCEGAFYLNEIIVSPQFTHLLVRIPSPICMSSFLDFPSLQVLSFPLSQPLLPQSLYPLFLLLTLVSLNLLWIRQVPGFFSIRRK